MPEEARNLIPVRFAIPQEALLSPEITRYGERNMEVYRDGALLIELASGFWGKTPDGSYVSPALRKNIYEQRGKGEWTADHIDFDAEMPAGVVVPSGYKRANWIQMADKINHKRGEYSAEGGNVTPVELPSSGWQVPDSEGIMYHPLTGSPLATLPRDEKDEAIRQLRDAGFEESDLSYFYIPDNGLRAVLRGHNLYDGGLFYVNANCGPDDGFSGLGARSRRRLEPLRSKGDAHDMVVAVSPEEYDRLQRMAHFYEMVTQEAAALEE